MTLTHSDLTTPTQIITSSVFGAFFHLYKHADSIHVHKCGISGNWAPLQLTLPSYYSVQQTSQTARTLASRIPPEQWSVHNHIHGSSVHMTNLILLLSDF